MPQVFRIGSYWVYFWANENKPLEPIHVHASKGKPSAAVSLLKSGFLFSEKLLIIVDD